MEEVSRKLRKEALYLAHKCQDGNLQSVFSCIDIVWTLYDKIMDWSVDSALDSDRDFFIISKGQATLALYPVLIEKGMFCLEEVAGEIGEFGSRYSIQTDLTKFHGGIENNAGSLGHGLPFAVGVAYANKVRKSPSQVYVLCGDGEFCEGTMWESCIFAGAKGLDNLHLIIDDNDSVKAMVPMGDMCRKLETFGLEAHSVDGHDMAALEKVFKETRLAKNNRPKVVVAHTTRGYGSKTMTSQDVWFHKAPNRDELYMLQKEVDAF